jgi:hypothetical protein
MLASMRVNHRTGILEDHVDSIVEYPREANNLKSVSQ